MTSKYKKNRKKKIFLLPGNFKLWIIISMALALICLASIEIFLLKEKILSHIVSQINSENDIKKNIINRSIDREISKADEIIIKISHKYSKSKIKNKANSIKIIEEKWQHIKPSSKNLNFKLSYYDRHGKYYNISEKNNPFDLSSALNISILDDITSLSDGKSFLHCKDYCQIFIVKPLSNYNLNSGIIQISISIDSLINKIAENIYGAEVIAFKRAGVTDNEVICLNGKKFIYETSTHNFSYRKLIEHSPELSCSTHTLKNENNTLNSYFERNGMLFMVSGSIDSFSEKYNQAITNITKDSAFILIALILFFYGMLSYTMKRITILGEILQSIAKKDFSIAKKKLTVFSRQKRHDEIDSIYSDVKHLTNELENSILEINSKNKQLVNQVKETQLLADYDTLTNIFNRRKFSLILNSILEKNEAFTLVSLDLNHFKLINDSLGHAAGDHVLVDFSKILTSTFRDKGTVGRMGGDEFSVVIYSTDTTIVSELLQQVADRTKKIFQQNSRGIHTSSSIGAASYPYHSTDIDELSSFADAAMYENKRWKKSAYNLYSGHETIIWEEREAQFWSDLFESGFSENLYIVYFQPIVNSNNNSLFSYEVLVRIKEKNTIHVPENFIKHAEKNRAIISIDRYVLKKAMIAGSKIGHPFLNINLSYLTLSSSQIIEYIIKCSTEYRYPLENIIIEITETIEINNINEIIKLIEIAKAQGLRFALDDFGTGFSSYSYMAKLGVDYIKLDKSLVQDLPYNNSNQCIAKSLVKLCKDLGIKTIAEGIENKAILNEISKYDFDYLQGYYFSHPKQASDFPAIKQIPRQRNAVTNH